VIAAFLLAAWCALDQTQTPARDTRPAATTTGSATIRGVVTTEEARPRPLRRARVVVSGPSLPMGRTAITDDAGAFVVSGLAPGRYTVSAAKDAYVSMNYGAARPLRPGITVAAGSAEAQRIVIRLPRGAVITGTVTDVDGSPVPGVSVAAATPRLNGFTGERRLGSVPGTAPAATDDRGVYRIYGLPAGEYMIVARTRQQAVGFTTPELRTMTQGMPSARPSVMAPVFHPSATDVARATRVTVEAGEERSGIDLQLQYVPLATVSGIAPVMVPGATPTVILVRMGETAGVEPARNARSSGPDGAFTIVGVPPGRYMVMTRSAAPPAPGALPAPAQWSSAEIVVDGEDVTNVALAAQTPVAIRGRLVFEGAHPAPDVSGIRVPELGAAMTIGTFLIPLPRLELEPGGRFVMAGVVPGVYKLGATSSRPLQGIRTSIGPWWLKSIVVDGRDILDTPLELRQNTDDAVVTFSDLASDLTGTVRDAAGGASADVFVVAFSTDRAAWFFNSRRIAAVRSDPQGRYSFRNLPPGSYRVVATTDLEQNEWFEPATLDRLTPAAETVTIAGPEKSLRDLVVR
jgi:uncharacterized protein (DUF2141 family)